MLPLDRSGNGTTFSIMASDLLSDARNLLPTRAFRLLAQRILRPAALRIVRPVALRYAARTKAEASMLQAEIQGLEEQITSLGDAVNLLNEELAEGGR
jgi:hypothetical protein